MLRLDELRREPLQIRQVDGLLVLLELFLEIIRLVAEFLVMLREFRRLAIAPVGGDLDLLGFLGLGIQANDRLVDGVDLGRDPALGVLALEEDVQKGEDGPELGEIEESHHRRAGDGQRKAVAMWPGKSYQPYEVFHVDQSRPGTCPMSVLAFSERRRAPIIGGRISTMIEGGRQSEFVATARRHCRDYPAIPLGFFGDRDYDPAGSRLQTHCARHRALRPRRHGGRYETARPG